MCSQLLFTPLLLALSLTLVICLEPEQSTTYIASTAPSKEIYGYPKHIHVRLVTKSLHDLVVDNRKLAAESKDELQKVQQRLGALDTRLSSQAAESKDGLQKVLQRLGGVDTRLSSQAAESKNLSNGLIEVLQRVGGVETRLTSQAAESKNLSNGLNEVLQRVGGVETRLTSQENATNILYQQKKTVFTLNTDSKKNWFEAFAKCRKRGLDLASTENEEEYQQVLSLINGLDDTQWNQGFWLSATDLTEDTYVWMSSGHNVKFAKWAPGEPNESSGEGEHCVELRYQENHKMNDQSCDYHNNYICESRNNENPFKSERRNKVFTVFNGTELSWYEALIDCKRQGLRLATVESQEEQEELIKSIIRQGISNGKMAVFWLSGSDLGRTNNYVWMTSGQSLNYTAWYSFTKEPNHLVHSGGTEHCLSVRRDFGYKWNDDVCSRKYYYICDNQD